MNVISRLKDRLLGEKITNTNSRNRPMWLHKHFDKRWWGERFAVMDLPPYKPAYRRYSKYKAWVCLGPNNVIHATAIVEVDLDERELNVEINR